MKKRLAELLFFLCCCSYLQGQDSRFSMYQHFGAYLNPASTGIDLKHNRETSFQAIYRNQWAAIPQAYQTYGAAFARRSTQFAWGALLHQNQAGAASFRTTGGLLTTAFYKTLSASGSSLSVGMGAGFLQKLVFQVKIRIEPLA